MSISITSHNDFQAAQILLSMKYSNPKKRGFDDIAGDTIKMPNPVSKNTEDLKVKKLRPSSSTTYTPKQNQLINMFLESTEALINRSGNPIRAKFEKSLRNKFILSSGKTEYITDPESVLFIPKIGKQLLKDSWEDTKEGFYLADIKKVTEEQDGSISISGKWIAYDEPIGGGSTVKLKPGVNFLPSFATEILTSTTVESNGKRGRGYTLTEKK